MAPTLRSQSAKSIRFLIVCTADIDINVLRQVLSNDGLVLAAKKDLSELATDNAELASFQTPFTEDLPEALESLGTFMDATKSKAGFSHKAFVILDQTTARDKTTCQIATDARDDEASAQIHLAFRCELSSIPPGLDAVEQAAEPTRTIRELRSEAAMLGGVWSKQRADDFRARDRCIDVGDYPLHQSWDEYSGCDSPETDIPYVPVFQTAKMSLDTINQFVESTYDQDWGVDDEEDAEEKEEKDDDERSDDDEGNDGDGKHVPPRIAFVTSIHAAPFHMGKAVPPLASAPQVPEAFFGASAAECDAVVRSRFPAEGSELNYNRFIVLDELSEKDKTVIIATNDEVDGQLLMSRCDFKGALLSLLTPEETGLTMDAMCHEAVTEGPGVMYGPE